MNDDGDLVVRLDVLDPRVGAQLLGLRAVRTPPGGASTTIVWSSTTSAPLDSRVARDRAASAVDAPGSSPTTSRSSATAALDAAAGAVAAARRSAGALETVTSPSAVSATDDQDRRRPPRNRDVCS